MCLKVGKSRPQTIQSGRRRVKHWRIELEFGLEILFIHVLGNSWFNYIGNQRKKKVPKMKQPTVEERMSMITVMKEIQTVIRWGIRINRDSTKIGIS